MSRLEDKYTPGPWRVASMAPRKPFDRSRLLICAQDTNVCSLYVAARQRGNDLADANLIASAPDLLEALEAAIRWIGRLTDWEGAGDPDVDAWRLAVNKAKGETS